MRFRRTPKSNYVIRFFLMLFDICIEKCGLIRKDKSDKYYWKLMMRFCNGCKLVKEKK